MNDKCSLQLSPHESDVSSTMYKGHTIAIIQLVNQQKYIGLIRYAK